MNKILNTNRKIFGIPLSPKKLSKHPLFSGSAVMVGGSMIANMVNYFYHLAMGRALGPAGYGVLASIFSIHYITSIIPMSSSFAIVKFISSAKTKKEKTKVYRGIKNLMFKLGVAGFLIMVVASPFIADFLHIEDTISVALTGPIIFFSLITLANLASMQGVLDFVGFVAPVITQSVGKLAFGLLLVYLGLSVTGAVGGILIAVIFSYILSVRLIRNRFKIEFKNNFKVKKFVKFAFPVLLQALAFTSFFTVDVILVKHFLPAFEAGLYAALSTLGKIIYFASQPITAAMFPIVSGRRAKGERYRNIFYMAFFLTVFVSIGIVAFYYIFPGFTIGLLYGSEYLAVTSELVWMGVFMAVYTACYLVVNFLLSVNRVKIVVLPLVASMGQAVGIWLWHATIMQVIQVSLFAMLALFASLSVYLGYYQYQKLYAK